MTCYHIIGKHSELTVRIPSDDKNTKEYEAKVVKLSSEKKEIQCATKGSDLALIEVHGLNRECQALEFCDTEVVDNVMPETAVFILGYVSPPTRKGSPSALNLVPAISPGTITTPVKKHGPRGMQNVVYTAASKHGASGGALIFGDKVLGVHFAQDIGRQTCYARSVNTVNMVLKRWLQIELNETRTTKELIEVLQSRI